MADELRKLIQSERNLLSGVSHELRSPIARIRLALTLARGADARERREMLDRIEQDTIQLDSMLEKILTVARLEGGQHKPKFENVSLRDIVENVLEDGRFEATAVDVDILFAGGPDVELSGDSDLLRSAVENIVRNAIFYSGAGGQIDVTLRRDNGTAMLSVRDNGPGVPEEASPTVQAFLSRRQFARNVDGRHGFGARHRAQRRVGARRNHHRTERRPPRITNRHYFAHCSHCAAQPAATTSHAGEEREIVCSKLRLVRNRLPPEHRVET